MAEPEGGSVRPPFFRRAYQYWLDRPVRLLLAFVVGIGLSLPGIQFFSFDASADTLVVQGDPELAFYREVTAQFGGDEFILMTLSPLTGDVFNAEALALIVTLEQELEALGGVINVLSLMDAPLLKNPPGPITEILNNLKTLKDEQVDLELAKEELLTSPLFKDLLVSSDGHATALRIDLAPETELDSLRQQRDALRETAPNSNQLARVTAAHQAARDDLIVRRAQLMDAVRGVRDRYQDQALLRIGGVPMMASDMIAFVKSDILYFGSAILVVMALMLLYFFRHPTWVLLSLASAAFTNLLLVGILGYIGQAATVVSSNFIALLAITTIALTIHLIVRYRELQSTGPNLPHATLVSEMLFSKFTPCVYTTLTTIVAFGSLALSKILPVEDFGWIMMIGIACSLLVSFTFFPAALLLLPIKAAAVRPKVRSDALLQGFAALAINRWRSLLLVTGALAVFTFYGINLITLDNRFIEYFRKGTDIREGLVFIDQQLGGTTPFDVIVHFPPWEAENADDFEGEDDFQDFTDESEAAYPQKYWFTPDKIRRLGDLHAYIESMPYTGKTLSAATLEWMARDFNDNQPLSAVELTAILEQIPDDLRTEFLRPYAYPEGGLMRINSRIIETGPYFSRDALIQDIAHYAENELGFRPNEVRTTGIMVMFNDMISQLLRSQTDTVVFVLIAVMVMFIFCLRSFSLAVLGLLPNVLAATLVMAVMGYVGTPLNMMTITIAAISLGIGVDDAIHYLHRYQEEKRAGANIKSAIRNAHRGVGRAMYYTSVTVVAGFSTLTLSNFIPNVTFGILVALAMVVALLANLLILPALLTAFALMPRFGSN